MNNVFDQYEVWFVTGAQLLYVTAFHKGFNSWV